MIEFPYLTSDVMSPEGKMAWNILKKIGWPRELRNVAAHEYVEEGLSKFFRLLKEEAPQLLSIEATLLKEIKDEIK